MSVFGTVKVGSLKLTVFSMICFAVFLAVCLIMLRAGAPDTVRIGGEPRTLTVDSDGDIAAFLADCGCEIETAVTDEEITVPKTWNTVYEEYSALQEEQGLDLVPYKGKAVRRLVYKLANSEDYAELLVADNRIIAAHLSTMKYGDPIRPLIIE